MLLPIISFILVIVIGKIVCSFCDKHNIEIPCSDDHTEWYDD